MPFTQRARMTISNEGTSSPPFFYQIGWKDGLYERQDDWSCATFWYEPIPSAPLPELLDQAARAANLWVE